MPSLSHAAAPMTSPCILVVNTDTDRAALIEMGLREAGHKDVVVTRQVEGLARQVVDIDPDVVLVDLQSPEPRALEGMLELTRAIKRPVALFVDDAPATSISAAVEAGVAAYVVDGLKKSRVATVVELAMSRYHAFSRLEADRDAARAELVERKTIERAKGLLMRSRRLGENEAYALMRKAAMDRNERIADVASHLLTAAAMLED